MKRRIELMDLVNELKSQNIRKKDFVVPAHLLSMENGKLVFLDSSNDELSKLLYEVGISSSDNRNKISLDCLPVFHTHLSDKLDIPKRYYNRINNCPDNRLIDQNISYWLSKHGGNVFLRTFIDNNSGYARAMLSDRYNVIDNFDVLFATLEAVKDSGLDLKIEDGGCDLSESKMYLRFIAPNIEIQAPELLKNYRNPNGENGVGNGIISGFCLTNSEVGQGQFTISPRATILKCSNGLIFNDDKFGKMHLGSRMEQYSQIDWSEETKRKNYELVMSQVKDAVRKFTSAEYLTGKISSLVEYATDKIENKIETIQNVTRHLSITEDKQRSILDYFLSGGDFSSMGVSQALTFYAHETKDADEAYDIEISAVKILPKIKKDFDKPFVNKSSQTRLLIN